MSASTCSRDCSSRRPAGRTPRPPPGASIPAPPPRGSAPPRGAGGLAGKKAGMADAVGLVDGLYPGAAAAGFRNFPDSKTTKAPRISEVYTKGTLTLARLGREAPIAAASPAGGAVLRDVTGGSLAARSLYPEPRQTRPEKLARSPIIGTDSPVRYEPSDSPGVRKRLPGAAVLEPQPERNDTEGEPGADARSV